VVAPGAQRRPTVLRGRGAGEARWAQRAGPTDRGVEARWCTENLVQERPEPLFPSRIFRTPRGCRWSREPRRCFLVQQKQSSAAGETGAYDVWARGQRVTGYVGPNASPARVVRTVPCSF
jgi:hypothetical protein